MKTPTTLGQNFGNSLTTYSGICKMKAISKSVERLKPYAAVY